MRFYKPFWFSGYIHKYVNINILNSRVYFKGGGVNNLIHVQNPKTFLNLKLCLSSPVRDLTQHTNIQKLMCVDFYFYNILATCNQTENKACHDEQKITASQ